MNFPDEVPFQCYCSKTTQSSVELIVFLSEDSLSWRPSGNLLAAAVRRPAGNRHVIAFFEKNGLQHGELELRHQQQLTIKQLEWNCDSTVLAICAQDQERKCRLFILFANLEWRRQLKVAVMFWNNPAVQLVLNLC
jgi:hypothetical protein